MRFDEVELQGVEVVEPSSRRAAESAPLAGSKTRRLVSFTLALLTDLSLFAALSLALFPLMPQPWGWRELTALGGFVLMLSYYYFAGAWMLWGKTIGGAIFDVRVEARTLRAASMRWLAIVIGVAAAAIVIAVALPR
jgi:hypothetical protein